MFKRRSRTAATMSRGATEPAAVPILTAVPQPSPYGRGLGQGNTGFLDPFADRASETFVAQHNDSHFCPWDTRLGFFVLYHDRPEAGRGEGLYLYDQVRGQWICIAHLDDLPENKWCQVKDSYSMLWPLLLCRAKNGIVTAQWSPAATP